jgi:hypothetical protein
MNDQEGDVLGGLQSLRSYSRQVPGRVHMLVGGGQLRGRGLVLDEL